METPRAEQNNGRRLVPTGRLPLLLLAAVLTLAVAGCGGDSSPAVSTATPALPPTTTAAGPPLLTSPAQKVSFVQAKQAIDALYKTHPGITSYVVDDVAYNETTRDKVLEVCHHGGQEADAASLESVRIAGCAPLVFYFYRYGQQRSVPESVAVARKLYWYGATNIHGPFSARASLTALLRSWGLR